MSAPDHNDKLKSAGGLLDRPLPPGYREEWARRFAAARAEPDDASEAARDTVFLFRIGAEWLALAAALLHEVAEPRRSHTLPHRRDRIVLGIVNIRGELIVAVSLAEVIGITAATTEQPGEQTRSVPRMLVIGRDGHRVAFPVDEVHGIHRYGPSDRLAVPATIGHARTRFATALIAWQGRTVGRLDDGLVLAAIEASLG